MEKDTMKEIIWSPMESPILYMGFMIADKSICASLVANLEQKRDTEHILFP